MLYNPFIFEKLNITIPFVRLMQENQIYDDIYSWKGWGGRLRLGSGKCRLRIYDLEKGDSKGLVHLKPIIVVVTDIPKKGMNDISIRSCASNIASNIIKDFSIDPQRMLYIEYYPDNTYGGKNVHVIPESYVAVEFTWNEDNAIDPKWRILKQPMLDVVKKLLGNK